MTINSTTLRPGLLVSFKTYMRGNVQYRKTVLEAAKVDESGQEKETWETLRTVSDAAELKAAKVARGKAGTLVRSVCSQSAFGLLCPEAEAEQLEKAISEAHKVCDEFNATAKLTRVGVYVLTGRIAADDVEAMKAITSEVRGLMDLMTEGIQTANVKQIREAANKAKGMGQMLSPGAAERVEVAIEAARKAARQIAKQSEEAVQQIDTNAIRRITEMRTSFLDLSDAQDIGEVQQQGVALDVDFDDSSEVQAAPVASQPVLEME